ncbi:MAG: adenylyltransferase/cytidyltransferase family protein [Desulfomonile tiedjei]|nr:adenylyltransferase/cytidyltransferase family protein [Desulfomonile tiedjei]
MFSPKVTPFNELVAAVRSLKEQGKVIVHCHGVFDLLHIGHIRYFEQARRMGDVLVVTVTPDRFVDKGPHRPAFPETLRSEGIASLKCVDYVAINEWPTAEETLRLLRPDLYVKGSEFRNVALDATGKIGKEEAVVREIGAKLAFTDDIVFSSSNLINRYFSGFPQEVTEYLSLFRYRHSLDEVLNYLEDLSSLRVLVVGDAIIDEYQYGQAIGKSSKDPIIAMKYESSEMFAGGALAVANHVANFASSVDLLTVLGEKDSHEEFINSRLKANVTPHWIYRPNAPTVLKRRYIDGYTLNKLLEIYLMDDSDLPEQTNNEACRWLDRRLADFDLVIAADFGHHTISEQMVGKMTDSAKFLAVMTQANAGNRGFHTISRYPRADYVCLAEHEIRVETRMANGSVRPMMDALAKKLGCSRFVVTRGRKGCLVWREESSFIEIPSFAPNVVDRVGAGDAFFSLTSLAACQGLPNEVLGFLGTIAGSMAVGIVGNMKSIDKMSVIKYITSIMK